MSFDQLSSLEAGNRRQSRGGSISGGAYADDPEFSRLSQDLMNKLFKLNGNNQRLSGEVGHLGTRRDTPRVRERVHELIEESRELFKQVGEGVKKIQTWEEVTVCHLALPLSSIFSQKKKKNYLQDHPTSLVYVLIHVVFTK